MIPEFDFDFEKDVKKDQEAKEKKWKKRLLDLKEILSTEAGVNFIAYMLETNYLFSVTFTGNASSHFKEGMRFVALKLLRDIKKANPEAFVTIMSKFKGERNE